MITLPQSPEAESSILGACMVDKDSLALVLESVVPDDFFTDSHRTVYKAIMELSQTSKPVDMVSVSDCLSGTPLFTLPSQLVSKIGTSLIYPYLKRWIEIVKSKSALRKTIMICQGALNQSQDPDAEPESIINEVTMSLGKIEMSGDTGLRHIHGVFKEIGGILYDYQTNPKIVSGITSGYHELDAKTMGFKPKRLTICAARPGVGKTAFACNLVHNAGIAAPNSIAFFSLEMDAESIGSRIIACAADVKVSNIQGRWVRGDEWTRFVQADGSFRNSKVWIDDTSRMTPQRIRSRCLRMKREVGKLDMVIIDYIGLMKGSRRQKRNEEIGEYSSELKALAKDLDTHVFCLAQLNRDTEGRAKPVLSNLKESGDLEQDADLVIFIHPHSEEKYEFIVAKNRHGYRGNVFLQWIPSTTRFESMTVL